MDDYSGMDWGYGGGDYSDWGNFSGYGGDTSGGNWFSNLLGGAGNVLSKPNTWSALLGLGQVAGSALSGGNKKPTYNYSPYQQQAYGQLQSLANTGLYNQQSIDDMLRLAQSSNVASGLAPNATSGMFRQTLGKLMLGDVANQAKFKSGVLGQIAGIGNQGVVQQAATPWYSNTAQTIQNLDQQALLQRLLGGNNMTTSPFLSSVFNMFA